jgi:hypothetical protein
MTMPPVYGSNCNFGTSSPVSKEYFMYEGESVNRSQMDIKHVTFEHGEKKHLFLDISSTNTDTLLPLLYQCIETRSIEVFWLLSQPLPHLRFNLFVIGETFATKAELLYATNTSHGKKISLWISFAFHRTLLLGSTPLKHGGHFDY